MRKILINDTIRGYADAYYEELKQRGILSEIEDALDNLIFDIPNTEDSKYVQYLTDIKDHLEEIIKMHPSEDNVLMKTFEAYDCDMGWNKWKSSTDTFAKRIHEEALNYKKIRSDVFPRYVQKLNIKTCVYCNTQYALTTGDEEGGELSAYYELDHAWPKSKYPYLAISFFNLQPCCGPCNKRKSNSGEPYSIYVEQPTDANSTVHFSINNESLANYILEHKADELKIDIEVGDKTLDGLYDRIGVRKMYAKLNDEAEDMVWKAKIYSPSYFQQLADVYKGIPINSRTGLSRLLYGIYDGEEYVYTRPLTKMKQDIVKQLKLI